MDGDSEAVDRMWQDFRAATGTDAELKGTFAFGDNPEMATRLADLVVHGPKRATVGLVMDFIRDNEPVPEPGDHWIVLDGEGQPACVIRTTEAETKPLSSVDAAFAWDEGEGDRTLEDWKEGHERFFRRHCERLGIPYDPDFPTVFERFELVWPR